jgi:pyrimidine-nucleoside phosphorylase
MRAVDLIRAKRDGHALSREAIDAFVEGVTTGTWPDYQTSALLMAIVWRGLSADETAWLTDAMVRSGARIRYDGLAHRPVDKHSTGGVGDKTSLILAPLAAACGAPVPMMSGRALGHTGGTLDKLESIPGFRVDLDEAAIKRALATVGCALVGQTGAIAPADRRLYALRDVTATVESVPLITASIMSKKIAEGIGGLVLDVKAGRGAFMKTEAEARGLASALVATGARAGVRTEAIITSMDAPLGRAVGNTLEVVEAVETLKGRGPDDVTELSVRLAASLLTLAGVEPTPDAAERRVRAALASGAGLETFARIVENQGGDARVVDDYARLPQTAEAETVGAPADGYLVRLDAGLVGRAAMALGAGRDRVDVAVDHAVGALVRARPGDRLCAGDPVVELRHRAGRGLAEAVALVREAVGMGDRPPAPVPLVLGTVEAPDQQP